jgi:hypothetical protein
MIELPEGNGFGTGYRLGKGPAFKRGDGILHVHIRRNLTTKTEEEIGWGFGRGFGIRDGEGYGHGIEFEGHFHLPEELNYPYDLLLREP